jgi:AraC-like DNA-binding protein
MQNSNSVFAGLLSDDIVEFENLGYTEAASLLSRYPRFRIRHDDDDELGYEQYIRISDGVLLRLVDVDILRDNRVSVCTLGGYVSCIFFLGGGSQITEEDGSEYQTVEGTCSITYYPEDRALEDFCRGGVKYVLVEVLIRWERLLEDFFNGDPATMPHLLRSTCMAEDIGTVLALPLSAELHQCLKTLTSTDFSGALRERFLEAKCAELVCLTMGLLQRRERGSSRRPLQERDMEQLDKVRSALVGDLSVPPSLDELASNLGMTRGTLSERFKQYYGLSIREYLLRERMEEAKSLLAREDLHINQVAWQLGYEHACNFVTAFRRQFGLTPNAYRKLELKS